MQKIKITPKLMIILKKYTKLFHRIEGRYYEELNKLEKMMEHETGIKDIEFFFCDNEFVGIGTSSEPTRMKLIHRRELEE